MGNMGRGFGGFGMGFPGMGPLSGMFSQQSRVRPIQKNKPSDYELIVTLEDLCKNFTKRMSVKHPVIRNINTKEIVDNIESVYEVCQTCKGSGQITHMVQLGPGMVQQSSTPCKTCSQSGYTLLPEYQYEMLSEIISVFIEKGMKDGDVIKVKNKGFFKIGTKPGDLHFKICERNHDIYCLLYTSPSPRD